MRVLLVEDDQALAQGVQLALTDQGFAVNHVNTGAAALSSIRSGDCDAVVLDLGLPDLDGLQVLTQLRLWSAIPVIVISARGKEQDKVQALDLGANDYLVKPFDLSELSARIGSVARRYAGNPNPLITLGALKIDLAAHAIHGPKGQIDLSQREWIIFEALLQRPGQIVSKSQIEDQIYAFDSEVESNTIEVYISRLRKKLGRDLIETHRGLGYRLRKPEPV